MPPSSRLFAAATSCLIIIDVQHGFLASAPPAARDEIAARIAWLARAARHLHIPTLVTLEEEAANGPLLPAVAAAVAGAPVFDKWSFGLAGQNDILTAVRATGRSHCVLVGMETDVCVAQSALGLLDQGFAVAVVIDACFSPPPFHAAGLDRMQAAGTALLTSKALLFEWAATLPLHLRLKAELGPPPPGVTF